MARRAQQSQATVQPVRRSARMANRNEKAVAQVVTNSSVAPVSNPPVVAAPAMRPDLEFIQNLPIDLLKVVLDNTSLTYLLSLTRSSTIKDQLGYSGYKIPSLQLNIYNEETRITSQYNETLIVKNDDEDQTAANKIVIGGILMSIRTEKYYSHMITTITTQNHFEGVSAILCFLKNVFKSLKCDVVLNSLRHETFEHLFASNIIQYCKCVKVDGKLIKFGDYFDSEFEQLNKMLSEGQELSFENVFYL